MAAVDSSGQDLLDVANQSWNSNRAEYSGIYYRLSVNQAMRQNIPDKHTKRKIRREDAATVVSHIFDQARQSDSDTLARVATDAVDNTAEGDNPITEFASEVAGTVQSTEDSGELKIIDPASLIALVMSIIQTVVPLFQSCKKPTPTPVVTP